MSFDIAAAMPVAEKIGGAERVTILDGTSRNKPVVMVFCIRKPAAFFTQTLAGRSSRAVKTCFLMNYSMYCSRQLRSV
jgi:hypothetical protein